MSPAIKVLKIFSIVDHLICIIHHVRAAAKFIYCRKNVDAFAGAN